MSQRTGVDFFSSRIQAAEVVPKKIPTVVFTARKCPVCHRLARVLLKPPTFELASEICLDHCDGLTKYPRSHKSFEGKSIGDGEVVVQLIKGIDGKDGARGPLPSREELIFLVKQVLREQGFWRRLFGRIK
jgi:hypothetical protein